MRLIDGDYLYNKLVANKCPYDLVLQMVKDEPTVCDIEQIKANSFCEGYKKATEQANSCIEQIRTEIEKKQKRFDDMLCHEHADICREILQIIDEYTKGEREYEAKRTIE